LLSEEQICYDAATTLAADIQCEEEMALMQAAAVSTAQANAPATAKKQ
jgi:hypothetical protein